MKKTLEKVGEWGLINLIRKKFSQASKVLVGIGDDAAVFKPKDKLYVLTTDTFVQDVHFSLSYFTPQDIGHRVLAATLSDLAAMSASPLGLLISLGLPKDFKVDFVEKIYEGLMGLASQYGIELWGGDTVSSPFFFLNLTAIGEKEEGHLPLRSLAKPGQLIVFTGDLGLSEAGRLALQKRLRGKVCEKLKQKHLRPFPRIKEAQIIGKFITGALEDTSDGLLTELKHITEESGVRAIIKLNKLPIEESLKLLAEKLKIDPLSLVLKGGEDFELVFTAFPKEIKEVKKELKSFNLKLNVVGEVVEGSGVFLKRGKRVEKVESFGYEHFK